MILIDSSYIIKALKVASNKLGKNQRDSGINFYSAVLKGKRLHWDDSKMVQDVPTLSDKSNFDVTARKCGQIPKVKVFSCPQMKISLF